MLYRRQWIWLALNQVVPPSLDATASEPPTPIDLGPSGGYIRRTKSERSSDASQSKSDLHPCINAARKSVVSPKTAAGNPLVRQLWTGQHFSRGRCLSRSCGNPSWMLECPSLVSSYLTESACAAIPPCLPETSRPAFWCPAYPFHDSHPTSDLLRRGTLQLADGHHQR